MTTEVSSIVTTTNPPWQLSPLPVQMGWSQFIRGAQGSGAGELFSFLTKGTFLEVKDNKFVGDSLIILLRSDFEQLVKAATVYSGATFRIKKILFSITETTRSYSDPSKADHLIRSISTQASLGLELANPMSTYASDAEFLAAEAATSPALAIEENLPSGKAELKDGVKKRK